MYEGAVLIETPLKLSEESRGSVPQVKYVNEQSITSRILWRKSMTYGIPVFECEQTHDMHL